MASSLAISLGRLEKRYGKGVVMDLSQAIDVHPHVPTGIPALDFVSGIGGIARGKMIEFYGLESSGKSTLALHVIAAFQNTKAPGYRTGRALYLDYEHALDLAYAKNLGVRTDNQLLLIAQPSTAEEGLEIAREYIDEQLVDIIIMDSVSAMLPEAEVAGLGRGKNSEKNQGEMGHARIGSQSQMMSQALKQLTARAHSKDVTIIWINQIRTMITKMGGRDTTSGGHALRFYASARFEIRKVAGLQGNMFDPFEGKMIKTTVATQVKIKAAKNKLAPPFREAPMLVRFGTGVDPYYTAVGYLEKHGKLPKSKQGHYNVQPFGASRNARGYEDLTKLLKTEPDVWQKMLKACDWEQAVRDSMKSVVITNVGDSAMESVDEDTDLGGDNPDLDALLGDAKGVEASVVESTSPQ